MKGTGLLSILLAGCLPLSTACNPLPESVAERTDADPCDRHPLVKALPIAASIAGLARNPPMCDWYSASVNYGNQSHDENALRECRITISDFQAEIPPELKQPEVAELMRETLEFNQGAHRAAIASNTSHYELMRNAGEWLNMIGGSQHLPIVDRLPDGGQYAIPIPSIQVGSKDASLTGLLRNERYGLSIECLEKIRDQTGARTLFAPWIAALNLGALSGTAAGVSRL